MVIAVGTEAVVGTMAIAVRAEAVVRTMVIAVGAEAVVRTVAIAVGAETVVGTVAIAIGTIAAVAMREGRIVMAATVARDNLASTEAAIPVRTAVCIVAGSKMEAAMSAMIGHIHPRTVIEEMRVMVVGIDGKIPSRSAPHHRTQEIVGCQKQIVLPIVEDVAEVGAAIAEASAIQVDARVQAEQIIHIDFVGIIILIGIEIELVCHLVGEEQCSFASLLVTHC